METWSAGHIGDAFCKRLGGGDSNMLMCFARSHLLLPTVNSAEGFNVMLRNPYA